MSSFSTGKYTYTFSEFVSNVTALATCFASINPFPFQFSCESRLVLSSMIWSFGFSVIRIISSWIFSLFYIGIFTRIYTTRYPFIRYSWSSDHFQSASQPDYNMDTERLICFPALVIRKQYCTNRLSSGLSAIQNLFLDVLIGIRYTALADSFCKTSARFSPS